MAVDMDAIFQLIGSFGFYQKTRFLLLSSYAGIVGGWALGVTMFLIMPPQHRCQFPYRQMSYPMQNFSDQTLQTLLIPNEFNPMMMQTGPSQCNMRNVTLVEEIVRKLQVNFALQDNPDMTFEDSLKDGIKFNDSLTGHTHPCNDGWWYNPNDKWTLVAEFDLVCSDNYLGHFLMTINSIGGIFGTILLSVVQDKFGRKPTLFCALAWYILIGASAVFMPSMIAYIIITTFRALAGIAHFQIPYVLCLEMVGFESNTIVINGMSIVFALAFALIALVCWLLHTWQKVVLCSTLPFLIFFGLWWLIDESPRWLLTNGREERGRKVVAKIARVNGKQIEPAVLVDLIKGRSNNKAKEVDNDQPSKEPEVASFRSLFLNRRLVTLSFSMAYLWSVNAMVYIGITLNTGNFGGNQYVVFALLALIEIPAYIINAIVVQRIGRVWPSVFCMVGSGIGMLLASAIDTVAPRWVVICCVVFAKFNITASFSTLYQLGGELFPTVLRASGIGFATTMSQVLSIVTPMIIYSATAFRILPMLILGGLSLTGGFLTLFFPETLGTQLPDTIEDMDKHGYIGPTSFLRNLRCIKPIPHQRPTNGAGNIQQNTPFLSEKGANF